MRTLQKLQYTIRLVCISAFFLCALAPTYIPVNARGDELQENELTSDQFLLVEEGFVMKTASISEAGYRLAYNTGIQHEVITNESFNSIAKLYNITPETIRFANDLKEDAVIHPGDTLLILPVDGVLHTVKRGQSLSKISLLYDIDLSSIMKQNQLHGEQIYAGQQLIIPGGKPLLAIASAKTGQGQGHVVRPGIEPEPPGPTPAPEASPPTSYGIFQKPCDCSYTQQYHPGHYAVDMSKNGGGPIFAAEDGIVIRAETGWNGGYGNVIEVDHGNGLVTLYAHNKALHVREGNTAHRGDVIATMGNTGRVYGQTGIHLHFEVILNGVKKSPLLYLQ